VKQFKGKAIHINSKDFKKAVSEKLTIVIGKVGGKTIKSEAIAREVGALAYKMGIKPDTMEGCRLKQFVPRLPNAHEDHLQALDKLLDKVNRHIRNSRDFSKLI